MFKKIIGLLGIAAVLVFSGCGDLATENSAESRGEVKFVVGVTVK